MATITEDYVSFEIAKLLKEKWFDIPCGSYFVIGENKKDKTKARFNTSSVISNRNSYNSELPDHEYISCPTLQMAMKWLREVHDIDISIIPLRSHKEYLPRIEGDTISHDAIPCRKYEEACEAAIRYTLENLI